MSPNTADLIRDLANALRNYAEEWHGERHDGPFAACPNLGCATDRQLLDRADTVRGPAPRTGA